MRVENSVRNATVSVCARFAEQLLAFVSRTVFIYFLSVEYLGITSLFSNVLSVLSLTELGIGTAINVALYKPLAMHDTNKVNSLMHLYKRAYRYVGLSLIGIGIVLVPFLDYLIKGTTELVNIRMVYLIYLAKTGISYFLYAYKRSLLEADQKSYIVSITTYGLQACWKVFQIILLILLRKTPEISFYVYCCGDMLCSIVLNIVISGIVDKKYPYINTENAEPLSAEEKKELFKNVFGVALYRVSSTVNGSVDSIIISAFLGTVVLGMYSNYLLIVVAITKTLNNMFRSITASVGNLNALGDDKKKNEVFNAIHFVGFWIYGFCVICLWVLLNPFLCTLWIGSDYRLSELIVFSLCMNYLVDEIMIAPLLFRNAAGLYWKSRYRAVVSVVINITLSLLAVTVFDWGIPGILLATIVSRLTVTLWVDTVIVHKYVLHCSPVPYFLKYFGSLLLVIMTGGMIKLAFINLEDNNIVYFLLRMICCIVLPNLFWWLLFKNKAEYKYLRNIMRGYINKKIHKKNKVIKPL